MKKPGLCCITNPLYKCFLCHWSMCEACLPTKYDDIRRGSDASEVAAYHKSFVYCRGMVLENLRDPHRSIRMWEYGKYDYRSAR